MRRQKPVIDSIKILFNTDQSIAVAKMSFRFLQEVFSVAIPKQRTGSLPKTFTSKKLFQPRPREARAI